MKPERVVTKPKCRMYVYGPEGDTVIEGKKADLKAMQEAVGGYIELAASCQGVCFFVNDEGRLRGLPVTAVRRIDLQAIRGPIVGVFADGVKPRAMALAEWRVLFEECFHRAVRPARRLAGQHTLTPLEGSDL